MSFGDALMTKIEQQLEMGRAFFSGDRLEINGGITVKDLQSIVSNITSQYEGQQINVKNIFEVMKQVFHQLDEISNHLSETKRKEIAEDLIHNIISANRNNEVQVFTDRALLLLVEYSLDAIAAETMKEELLAPIFLSPVPTSIEAESIRLSPKVQQEDALSRSRFEKDNLNLFKELKVEKVMENELLDEVSPTSFIEPQIIKCSSLIHDQEEIEEEVLVPSRHASIALSKMAADNPVAIENQVEEVVQYIRNTSIEVDEKIALAQEEIHRCIDQALERVDLAYDKLKEMLERSREMSLEAQGQIVNTVNELAERLIEAIQKTSSPLIETQSSGQSIIDLPNLPPSTELPIQEIIADLAL